ncbi:Rrf2 family transcriptional regulator [Vulcaniibacterium tengchongense]|uniref:Rrf2 family protein n=1 Tax=Vulcaniibacterium tengchongense TaxID=1273429 RepID=A0A3N4V2N1_9GAMM|nr:Rrf2 family transcriptional regulator [Vulcaniibacterium tengchongense]RPE77232.1 Rrf2 family protein [Vulcaniibacterium tengchongense]
MKKDSRLSSMLHVLLHIAQSERPLTSAELAAYLQTDPAVVRRTLSGLRELGYVSSAKGHGGGWTLTCDLARVTLRDVYEAVGAPEVFALGHRSEAPRCLVEQAVNATLDDAFREAEALLVRRLGEVTLADLAADFGRRLAARGHRRIRHAH